VFGELRALDANLEQGNKLGFCLLKLLGDCKCHGENHDHASL
jgi:hypothetical protein